MDPVYQITSFATYFTVTLLSLRYKTKFMGNINCLLRPENDEPKNERKNAFLRELQNRSNKPTMRC